MKFYSTETHALIDTGAVPNLIFQEFCARLSLSPKATDLKIKVTDGAVARVLGCFMYVPVSFGALFVLLDILMVRNYRYKVIVGSHTLEAMQACLDYRR